MPLFSLLSLFSLFSLFYLSSAHTATLSLSPSAVAPPFTNPWQRLNHLATASATRAHHLKHHKPNISTTVKAPLFPRGYGGYAVSLSFGTPPQKLSFLMDTGSSLVWFPCTQSYACSSCNFEGVDPTNVTTFVPELSSSTKIVGCRNRKCRWLFPNVECRDCEKNSIGCDDFCPSFTINYGSGSATGRLLSETLIIPGKSVDNFIAGCSVFATAAPAGIAGFGRGPESLPSQMRLKRFSYCLVSHWFDDAPVASDLVLVTGDGGGGATNITGGRINYTPFRKIKTTSNPAFKEYYYVTLRKITVGGVDIRAPYEFLVPDSAGNGGTIVDSGTTFTFMENPVFELVAREFEKQVGKNYSRATEVENMSGLRPCFNVSDENSLSLPQLSFHFKGGARLVLPLGNYFSFMADSVVCMTVNTNNGGGGGVGPGPTIILGNYQQQNIYMEYDLENERLGFRKQFCR